MNRELPIADIEKIPFWYGDRVYTVAHVTNSHKYFLAICPSCGDTRSIRYIGHDGKEYEVQCPYCEGKQRLGATDNRLDMDDWFVMEYIINKIEIKGPDTKNKYTGIIPSASISLMSAFSKCGNGYNNTYIKNIPYRRSNSIDPDIDKVDLDTLGRSDYYFHNKRDADKLVKKMKEYDKSRLKAFNEKYGTEYEYPYPA